MSEPGSVIRDPTTDSYWIFGGFLLATGLHQASYSFLQSHCEDFKRFRLKHVQFSDLSMKMARVVYFSGIGIILLSILINALRLSPLTFPANFYDDVNRWSGAALFTVAFDVYELGHLRGLRGQIVRITHHLLELGITLAWLSTRPSPMLVYAGSYVVAANFGFILPVLMRILPMSHQQQRVSALTSMAIIMVAMGVTDLLVLRHLALFWFETPLARRISAIAFTIGFTTVDALMCKGYFYPLYVKATTGILYSPPPKGVRRVDSNMDSFVARGDTTLRDIRVMFKDQTIRHKDMLGSTTIRSTIIPNTTTKTTAKSWKMAGMIELSPRSADNTTTTTPVPVNANGEEQSIILKKEQNPFDAMSPTRTLPTRPFDMPNTKDADSFVFSDDSRMFSGDSRIFSGDETLESSSSSDEDFTMPTATSPRLGVSDGRFKLDPPANPSPRRSSAPAPKWSKFARRPSAAELALENGNGSLSGKRALFDKRKSLPPTLPSVDDLDAVNGALSPRSQKRALFDKRKSLPPTLPSVEDLDASQEVLSPNAPTPNQGELKYSPRNFTFSPAETDAATAAATRPTHRTLRSIDLERDSPSSSTSSRYSHGSIPSQMVRSPLSLGVDGAKAGAGPVRMVRAPARAVPAIPSEFMRGKHGATVTGAPARAIPAAPTDDQVNATVTAHAGAPPAVPIIPADLPRAKVFRPQRQQTIRDETQKFNRSTQRQHEDLSDISSVSRFSPSTSSRSPSPADAAGAAAPSPSPAAIVPSLVADHQPRKDHPIYM